MKYILTILLISFGLHASAELTAEQETVVIQQLNDYCADSWCESAVDFNFKKIDCVDSLESCNLYFTTQDNSTADQPIMDQMCEIRPYTHFEQMVSNQTLLESGHFNAANLKDGFVAEVDECAERFFH